MQVNGPGGQKVARKKSLAVGVACMAIYGPAAGLKVRPFELRVLNRQVFKFCVGSTPLLCSLSVAPQWGAADVEIKVPSDENTEIKGFPFKTKSRSVYSHTYYAYCQVLPCLFLPFRSIHLHFFQNLSRVFPVLAVANTDSCVGSQNKIGQPAGCGFPCLVPTKYK